MHRLIRRGLITVGVAFLALITVGMFAQAAEMDWETTVKTENMVLEATGDILSVPIGHAQAVLHFTSTDGHDGMIGGVQPDLDAGGDRSDAYEDATRRVTSIQTSTKFRENFTKAWMQDMFRERSIDTIALTQERPFVAVENRHTDGGRSATNADIAGVLAGTFIREPMVTTIGA